MRYYCHIIGQKKRRKMFDALLEMGFNSAVRVYKKGWVPYYCHKYCGFRLEGKMFTQVYHKEIMKHELLSEEEFMSVAKLLSL